MKRQHMSVIVPYRDRLKHLKIFLQQVNKFLIKNLQCTYDILIIEQNNKQLFNRGKLCNIGFDLASKAGKSSYICIHDVDTTPNNMTLPSIYNEPEFPTHICYGRSTENYQLLYPNFFGGINLFLNEHFKQINGFSNLFEGWGGEDDDLLNRCAKESLTVVRRKGYFNHETHPPDSRENHHNNVAFLNKTQIETQLYKNDGLNSLNYKIIKKSHLAKRCFNFKVDFL